MPPPRQRSARSYWPTPQERVRLEGTTTAPPVLWVCCCEEQGGLFTSEREAFESWGRHRAVCALRPADEAR